ncbi:MPPV-320 hypothetical protein [Magpiepox virus 2]|nr:hypothetical protein [Magpiepox virus]QZW33652.1 MPPV-320 hypothetical protein [Magpiepox virus 2]
MIMSSKNKFFIYLTEKKHLTIIRDIYYRTSFCNI